MPLPLLLTRIVSVAVLLTCPLALGGPVRATSASGWSSIAEHNAEATEVCARESETRVACGRVVYRWGNHVVVRWQQRVPGHKIKVGAQISANDGVALAASESSEGLPPGGLAAEINRLVFQVTSLGSGTGPALGASETKTEMQLSLGANGLSAIGALNGAVTNRLALGIAPSFIPLSKSGYKNSLLGGFLLASYFPMEMWKGIWLQGGVGYFFGKSTYRQISGPQGGLSLLATAGWREKLGALNLGIAAGVHYVSLSRSSTINYSLRALSPTVWIDVGFLL